MGKAPAGAARLAKKYDIPVVALGGSIAKDGAVCNESGIDALFSIVKGPMSLKKSDGTRYRKGQSFRYGRTGVPADPELSKNEKRLVSCSCFPV